MMHDLPENHKPKVHLITMRMKGHAGPSGYDRLTDFLDATVIAPAPKLSIFSRVVAKILSRLIINSGVLWYHEREFICEMRAALYWLGTTGSLFHFVYGENSFRYLPAIKRLFPKNKIICTFHTPAERFDSLVTNKDYLRAIDAVVVVSNSQKIYFSNILDHDKIHFIPHGIDIEAFSPGPKRRVSNGKYHCIFVGKHLRDVDCMIKIVSEAENRCPRAHFHLISNEDTLSLFEGRDNISTYQNVSDEKLLSLYQSADVLTLPLLESTANNTILEAIACGLPVITTDLIGTRDYLNENCAMFSPNGDAHAFVSQIEYMMNHPDRRDQMAKACRKRAQELSWMTVAGQLEYLYRKINNS
jgi:glycosyltransferase involved in cell wall biosynthesis